MADLLRTLLDVAGAMQDWSGRLVAAVNRVKAGGAAKKRKQPSPSDDPPNKRQKTDDHQTEEEEELRDREKDSGSHSGSHSEGNGVWGPGKRGKIKGNIQ
jgi:hypothetical protein